MYLILVIGVYIIFAKVFVNWKNWREYYPTILLFLVFNMLYNFLFYNHTLWAYRAVTVDWLNHTIIELTFSFFILPVVIMMYLQYYPKGKKSVLYVGVWVAYFSFIEYLFYRKGLFVYDNGWNPFWSTIFNLIIFSILRIHYKNPLIAWGISVPIIILLLTLFHPTLSELK